MKRPNLLVSIKIAELFPNISAVALWDEELGKWDAMIIKLKENEELTMERLNMGYYEVIYSLDLFIFNEEKDAMDCMNEVIQSCIRTVKTMSN